MPLCVKASNCYIRLGQFGRRGLALDKSVLVRVGYSRHRALALTLQAASCPVISTSELLLHMPMYTTSQVPLVIFPYVKFLIILDRYATPSASSLQQSHCERMFARGLVRCDLQSFWSPHWGICANSLMDIIHVWICSVLSSG